MDKDEIELKDIKAAQEESDKEKLKLKIDAHVVRQLGAELISGPEIALLELVKNSFDADAYYCHVDILTNYTECIDGHVYKGKITIRDNGHGMSREVINRNWLTISHSEKRHAKTKGKKTKIHERNYTGDKGLGRLGSMQLGRLCRIKTHHKPDEDGLEVYFDWSHFQHGRTLDSVSIYENSIPPKKKTSTEIEVVGLNDLDYWRNDRNLTKLKYKLSSMVSPFGHLKNFDVYLNIEGIESQLEIVDEKVRGLCASQFDFEFDGEILKTSGELKLNNFKPTDINDQSYFDRYVKSDSGKGLFDYLSNNKSLSGYEQVLVNGTYFIKFSTEIDIKDISATSKRLKKKAILLGESLDKDKPKFTHPGSFDGKIYQFVFKKDSLKLDKMSFDETKSLVQELTGGVAAYRDGFRIGSNRGDWLGLADDMTSGGGAYSLRPGNTAGFINLTWENNSGLQEKSDRESFIENEAFEGFYILCQEIIDSINSYLNKSRRASLNYLRLRNEQDQDKPKSYSGRHAVTELSVITKKAKKTHEQVHRKNNEANLLFSKSRNELEKAIVDNEQSLFHDPSFTNAVKHIREHTEQLEKQFKEFASGYEDYTKELSQHIISVDKIKFEIESYEEQIKNFYDHVAIGLSAQALAHEANSQVNNIYFHLNSALKRVKELGIKDNSLTKSLLSIRSDGQVLSKSISTLDPLVRAQRNVVERLELSEEIKSYLDLRINYFKNKGIEIVYREKSKPISLKFNRGKLFQVIDNVVRNSEHWLEVFSTHNPTEELQIFIEIDGSELKIWDSGRGVRPALEDILFDMFASDKQLGQGLGLFIVKNILEEKGCSISLLEERNRFGRRYKFAIELQEAMD
ncbi:MAG: sensor histidine kinase [Pseudomonadota bacterium]|nr:sensor histidine kinase [Pseudomonadota bacterium]